jgi:predicted Zn finger-like uncharacterized protein
MSLATTCPKCGTIFRVHREQLDASNGWVRCGHCMNVFDAKSQFTSADLIDLKEAPGFPSTKSDVGEFSFMQASRHQAFWSSLAVRSFLASLVFTLTLLFVFQVVRNHALSIQKKWPQLSPFFLSFCHQLRCQQGAIRQIDGWLIDSSSFKSEGLGRFKLTVQLKNISAHSLLSPSIELSLLGAHDALKVRHVIAMSVPGSNDAIVKAGSDHTFEFFIQPNSLVFKDAALRPDEVLGYRLVLFYP